MKFTIGFLAGALVGRRVLVTLSSRINLGDKFQKNVKDRIANLAFDIGEALVEGTRPRKEDS